MYITLQYMWCDQPNKLPRKYDFSGRIMYAKLVSFTYSFLQLLKQNPL